MPMPKQLILVPAIDLSFHHLCKASALLMREMPYSCHTRARDPQIVFSLVDAITRSTQRAANTDDPIYRPTICIGLCLLPNEQYELY